MSSHHIPQIHSTQMSEFLWTTSFILSSFFNKNLFLIGKLTWVLKEEIILKIF